MEEVKVLMVHPDKMTGEFFRILASLGFSEERADKLAGIFTQNSVEGVLSHGVYRFPRFVRNIKEGIIIPSAVPAKVNSNGGVEQWNGNLGPGPLNAFFASDRAIELAKNNGIGMVALANTNHWMRAGTYGWYAAKKGFVFIAWTNTCQNMPAWGGTDPKLGNNPMVFAVPYGEKAVVLDFAMSQFSFGKMEAYKSEGKKLPYPGGYNLKGELTDDPSDILESFRPLPVGYWKGSGLALMLDILAAVLSGGISAHEVKSCQSEYGVSQVFISIDITKLFNYPGIKTSIDNIMHDLHSSIPVNGNTRIRYPGENLENIIRKSYSEGIPVTEKVWTEILQL